MQNTTRFAPGRKLDAIYIGRLALDLYARNLGARLEDVTAFAKYLGGSSANQAFGLARLGLKSGMIIRTGDDHMGRFLTETLAREGCDVSHVHVDPERLTALAVLGIKDRDTFPLLFFRENCADWAVSPEDIDEDYVASAKVLAITGTHLSRESSANACRAALACARRHDVRTVLDIDYRPVLWGLTGKALGENRYVKSDRVSAHIQQFLPSFDLLIGTEEEFQIAGGSSDVMAALTTVRTFTPALLVVKRGAHGCAVIEGPVPPGLDDAPNFGGFPVEVMNVLGAGDAFGAGFVYGWIRGEDIDACCRYANACGALVVSRHGCAPAMPTLPELEYFLANYDRLTPRPAEDAMLNHLHRVTAPRTDRSTVCTLAFDHRTQFIDLARDSGSDPARIGRLKRLLVDAVAGVEGAHGLGGKVGVLIDDVQGADALDAATGRGWWIGRPVELPGSNPVVFQHGRSVGTTLQSWPAEHVAKILVAYHPDDAIDRRLENEAQVQSLYQAVQVSGNELLVEIVPPRNMPRDDQTVLRAVKRFYNIGVRPEWWKLESMSAPAWAALEALIAERDPYCRGVLVLGLDAPLEKVKAGLAQARRSRVCRGFAVGRTLWAAPSREWFAGRIDDAELVRRVSTGYLELVRAFREG